MDDVVALYARHARPFDAARTRSLVERPYLEAAAALAPPPGKVLDLGCGGGEPIARHFIEAGYQVTGVDAATEMLDMCRARFPAMTWLAADMRSMDVAGPFDIVIAWDSFFHLDPDDQRRMFATFRQHAAARGVLVFTSGTAEGEQAGDLFGDRLFHASLDTAEYARLLALHGYDVVLHRAEDPACGGHTVWVARVHAAGV